MVWGQAKRYFRERADGTFPKAQKLVVEALDHVSNLNVRRYFRHCFRYMDAYQFGLNIRQAAYAVKKYPSHRRIPAFIMRDEGIIARGTSK
ncbi:hypothetical protein B0H17DRAFT_1101754 [Mycena rosella]|uniref:Uncharacterized protein n=1 Tax=Mycena rosella TaxID=1033263 RepID=A0AAD7CLL9_MYCRO|nr:hypothetical protein B0H17DRAFT_1101754 [Mycena rosella]